jgi:tRNA pseudouridine32 synthase/23S rRNA pseudouridine746 synthase
MHYLNIFNNEHFIIVNKSAGVLSVPSRLGKEETRPVLGLILESDLGIQLFPVHRLDFEVQGLIMFAKTPSAQKAGNAWFEQKTIEKKYSALSLQNSTYKVGVELQWKCRILRGKKRAYESPVGKESVTIARLVSITEKGYFHWELSPVTGRSHQLRYELFRHELPIIGDELYGSRENFNGEGIALRSFELNFSRVKNRETFSLPEKIMIATF